MLDSECSRGGAASDATLVATYNKHFKSHANFSVCGPSTGWRRTNDSHSLTNHDDFVVIHFAGPVIYTCVDFVDRNRDALFEHVNSLMGTSKNKMVRYTQVHIGEKAHPPPAVSPTHLIHFTVP